LVKKRPVRTGRLFDQKKIEKSTHLGVWFGFGSSLVRPNIWFFMRLGVKTNYGRHPLGHRPGHDFRFSKSTAFAFGAVDPMSVILFLMHGGEYLKNI